MITTQLHEQMIAFMLHGQSLGRLSFVDSKLRLEPVNGTNGCGAQVVHLAVADGTPNNDLTCLNCSTVTAQQIKAAPNAPIARQFGLSTAAWRIGLSTQR